MEEVTKALNSLRDLLGNFEAILLLISSIFVLVKPLRHKVRNFFYKMFGVDMQKQKLEEIGKQVDNISNNVNSKLEEFSSSIGGIEEQLSLNKEANLHILKTNIMNTCEKYFNQDKIPDEVVYLLIEDYELYSKKFNGNGQIRSMVGRISDKFNLNIEL